MSKSKRGWLTSWIPHRLELYLSPAWSLAPRPLKTILERLEIEHLRHGGYNNGELFVAYPAFVEHGLSRKSIKRTLQLGACLGLLEVIPATSNGVIRPANAYRLTYVPAKGKDTPTDEWKSVTLAHAERLIEAYRADEKVAVKATRKAAA